MGSFLIASAMSLTPPVMVEHSLCFNCSKWGAGVKERTNVKSRLSSFGKVAFSLLSCLPVPLVLLYSVPGLGAVVGC